MDANKLLDQFFGGGTGDGLRRASGALQGRMAGKGDFLGGAAAGGILGMLMGNKKMRKMAGGAAGYGGAAALGALAYKAYQNWQEGKSAASAPTPSPEEVARTDSKFLPGAAPAADGKPFELTLVRAMIGAAKADGHVDAQEQTLLFEQVERLGLDAESKAFVFDALAKPADLTQIASAARGQEQASEIYLVSRLAIDPDHPAEKAYLEALGHRLGLPKDLVMHLEHQVEAGTEPASG